MRQVLHGLQGPKSASGLCATTIVWPKQLADFNYYYPMLFSVSQRVHGAEKASLFIGKLAVLSSKIDAFLEANAGLLGPVKNSCSTLNQDSVHLRRNH